jgi:hypothetical protein
MSREAALAFGCVALAFGAVVGALRCLADKFLASAVIYAVIAAGLLGGAVRAAIDAF